MMFDVKQYAYGLIIGGKIIGHVATDSESLGLHCTPLSLLVIGDKLVCATDREFVHSKSISENPDVAISFDCGIQLVCHAGINGSVLSEQNKAIADKYARVYSEEWKKYSTICNQVFIVFTVLHIKVWRYIDGVPYQGWYDACLNKTTVEEYKPLIEQAVLEVLHRRTGGAFSEVANAVVQR